MKAGETPITEAELIKLGFTKEPLDDDAYYYALSLSEDKYEDLALISNETHDEVALFPHEGFVYQTVEEVLNLYRGIMRKSLVPQKKLNIMEAPDFLRLHNEGLAKEDSCFANIRSPYESNIFHSEKFTEGEMIAFAESYAQYVRDCAPPTSQLFLTLKIPSLSQIGK